MFVILTYDIEEKRINRVRKTLKKYLTWTQNSVFEGEITEGKLHKCLSEINKLIDKKADSIYVYRVKISKNIRKDVIGIEKSFDELFL
ncbi:CRISPR-associated endonuclease Cas2 [Clostridium algidicarnis]|uniref:CRISPR-associated endonuclease Cas2 n=1 Tax=Clostridium algidicarnis TaxID=37659 RepID=UPI000494F58C|nr:CRISPR-associated endonuclease Cas2 [Clostridium algidicarnis]MBB6697552.1 CRISPR-associated endonuclease Cas2 [Clostridium algidicarnis]MBU3203359.1 CRISPR-associated endonuclease Cas2 [Clostridium algidicarnis]MBU3207814.1 CRISPR-associated endonuclease Cas2 [Clostridium algidicarnis]MBU3211513.1 CRISPR-associated endonuclease Cas2 [Clostridium algidicarnis]MBU3221979.1 CRISPR-associated endonuclease Cas2 [Clostridium algidicarnis]